MGAERMFSPPPSHEEHGSGLDEFARRRDGAHTIHTLATWHNTIGRNLAACAQGSDGLPTLAGHDLFLFAALSGTAEVQYLLQGTMRPGTLRQVCGLLEGPEMGACRAGLDNPEILLDVGDESIDQSRRDPLGL